MYYLKLLGPPALATSEGTPLTGPASQRHRIALLALLAVAGKRAASRDWLMATLWPESDTRQARNLLKVAVYVVRRALGDDALLSEGDGLRLNLDRVQSDVVALEAAASQQDHERVVELYRGPFMHGFFLKHAPSFERWVEIERERLARAHSGALEALAEDAETRGDLPDAVRWWEACAAARPYDSRLALRLMRALDLTGNQGGALRHADVHERTLRSDLGIAPSEDVRSFVDRLRARAQAERPSARLAAERDDPSGATRPPFRLQTLGRPALHGPEGTLTAASGDDELGLILLAVLARAGVYGVPRETLLLYFWPELPWRDADEALEGLLGTVRSWTWSSAVIGGDPVVLDRSVVASDLAALEEAARGGSWEDVLAITQSTFLEGAGRERSPELTAWVGAQRVHVEAIREAAERAQRGLEKSASSSSAAAMRPAWRSGRSKALGFGAAAFSLVALGTYAIVTASTKSMPLLPRETTTNAAARDLYDQGNNPLRFRNDSIARVSLDYFKRAVEVDPDYAGAHAELAFMYVRVPPLPGAGRVERLALAEQHARKAVKVSSSLADAHAALGGVLLHSYRFAEAQESLTRALELDPRLTVASQLLGQLLIFRGRFEELLAPAMRAWENDPASPTAVNEVARGHILNGRCGEALRWLDSIRHVDPPLLFTVALRSECLRQQGSWEEAIDLLRGTVPAAESTMLATLGITLGQASRAGSTPGPDSSGMRLAWAQEARAIRDTLLARASQGRATAFNVATVYTGLGELDLAIDWLMHAVEDRTLGFQVMEPRYRELHTHPRFDSLMTLLGLPDG